MNAKNTPKQDKANKIHQNKTKLTINMNFFYHIIISILSKYKISYAKIIMSRIKLKKNANSEIIFYTLYNP